MKFTVSQSSLTQALTTVMKGIAGTSTLPILAGVLMRATDGVIEFQTSNYTIAIRHRIAARVDEDGAMVVPCKMLANITKTLPDAPVNFELEDRQVKISCEKSSFRLNTLDVGDFPEFPSYSLTNSVELPADILSDMVARVWKVTSTDKNRPVLNGVYMTVENNTIRLVATDSYRLAVCDTQVETSSLEGSFELNVPSEAMNDALSITAGQGSITIGSTDTQVVFIAGNTTYIARRIEGVYPNYKALLPKACTTTVKINIEALSAALKRVAVIAQNNSAVRFEIDTDIKTLSLSAISNDQDAAHESIDVEVEGESGIIAFNYHYIFGCLNVLGREKEITLELQSYAQAGVFKSYDKINYLYLVMPVRI
ncbi:DNA polymerase III subunit beta [Collinsella sp. zg1085]|uniref:DNA polymerase III subunit beta n=1 Tax=Collinsella sp. zg1085 TaxID=2844380 RepID=UPI001C0C632E|nr:DNA polymerase III subunit beta [Collinsella sp. zg1085]QWT17604.1 DNA polymerase III subunit beta [Collinsella sp. zg1085]